VQYEITYSDNIEPYTILYTVITCEFRESDLCVFVEFERLGPINCELFKFKYCDESNDRSSESFEIFIFTIRYFFSNHAVYLVLYSAFDYILIGEKIRLENLKSFSKTIF